VAQSNYTQEAKCVFGTVKLTVWVQWTVSLTARLC